MITQNPCDSQCPWHGCHPQGNEYAREAILPNDVCPFLYHSLYPYFLGLLYNADMQDIWACCPGERGVDCYVRKVNNDDQFEDIPADWWVIYAEIENVGDCPHGHYKGEKIVFPTAFKKDFICPAGLNNIFPFLPLGVPACINREKLRCPDWKDNITYSIGGDNGNS